MTVVGHDMKAPLMHLTHPLGVEPKAALDTMLLWKLRDLGEHIDDPKHFNLERVRAAPTARSPTLSWTPPAGA